MIYVNTFQLLRSDLTALTSGCDGADDILIIESNIMQIVDPFFKVLSSFISNVMFVGSISFNGGIDSDELSRFIMPTSKLDWSL